MTRQKIARLRELERKVTAGPWRWTTDSAGPPDEYGCPTRGEIDPRTFKSTGYCGNPQLYGPDFDNDEVIDAGAGEYTPYNKAEDAVLIAAMRNALPDLLSMADKWAQVVEMRDVIEQRLAQCRCCFGHGKYIAADGLWDDCPRCADDVSLLALIDGAKE